MRPSHLITTKMILKINNFKTKMRLKFTFNPYNNFMMIQF